jgi:hypothetical protein
MDTDAAELPREKLPPRGDAGRAMLPLDPLAPRAEPAGDAPEMRADLWPGVDDALSVSSRGAEGRADRGEECPDGIHVEVRGGQQQRGPKA